MRYACSRSSSTQTGADFSCRPALSTISSLSPRRRRATTISRRQLSSYPSGSSLTNTGKLYLHVGPAGECWTGASIFAAKHLQPDYVKSVQLPDDFVENPSAIEHLLEELEEDPATAQQIYDSEQIPEALLDKTKVRGD